MSKLSKDTIEFIDTICEWPPVEFDIWPFATFEERQKENRNVAEISQFISTRVIEDTDLEYITELLQRITSINFKMIRELITEVTERRRQQLNLESRIFTLEQKKRVSSFD